MSTRWWQHRWVAHVVALAFFATVASAFLWPAVSRQQVYTTAANTQSITFPWTMEWDEFRPAVQADESHLSTPWQTLLTRSVRDEGELAFWNPHSFAGGVPLFANGSSGQLSPVRLASAFWMSPTTAHEFSSLWHLTMAGFGGYLLLRSLRSRFLGGLAGGLTWQCSGFALAWLHLEVVTPTFAYTPLLVALIARAVRGRSALDTLAAGAVGALLLVSGHLLFAAVSLVVAFGYAAFLCLEGWRREDPDRWRLVTRRVLAAGGAGVVAVGLAAVVLVPTAIELRESPRLPVTLDDLLKSGVAEPGEVLARVAWPDGLPIDADEIHFQPFIGTIGAALAVLGFCLRGRRGAALARVLVVVGLLAALDGPVMRVLIHLPVFSTFRPYGRLSLWVVLGLAILVGHAVDHLASWLGRWSKPGATLAVTLLLVANTLQLLSWGRGTSDTFWPRSTEYTLPLRPVLEGALAQRAESGWPTMLIAVSRGEPGDGFYPDTLGGELHTVFGLDTTSGYDSTVPTRTSQMTRLLAGDPVERVVRSPGRSGAERPRYVSSAVRWDLLDRFGVGLVLLPPFLDPADPTWGSPGRAEALGEVLHQDTDGILVRVSGQGSGPRLVADTEVVASTGEALERFADADFAHEEKVLLEREGWERADEPPGGGGSGTVLRAGRGTNSAFAEVDLDAPMWLVFPINWHAGWSATVNGETVDPVRVNAQRLAIPLPAGSHAVRLEFRPPGLALGAGISLATALSALALAGYALVGRRRDGSDTGPDTAGLDTEDADGAPPPTESERPLDDLDGGTEHRRHVEPDRQHPRTGAHDTTAVVVGQP